MRGLSNWIVLPALAFVAGCRAPGGDLVAPPPIESEPALITGIQVPTDVRVNDDVTVRYNVVIGPCRQFYYAQDRLDGEVMRFTAFSIAGPCTTSTTTTHAVEFFLQGPQKAHRALLFEEPDGADSLRVLNATGGQ